MSREIVINATKHESRIADPGKKRIIIGSITGQRLRRVIDIFRHVRPPAQSDYHLTPHEMRLLKLLVEGHSYKTAGVHLGVTPHTVSFHLRRIYEKLQVHTKSEAVAKALRHGLIR